MEETNTNTSDIRSVVTPSQIALIVVAVIALLGMTWLKRPELFSFAATKTAADSELNLPRYYAYEPSAEDAIPMVAGASTEAAGPSIINEDGSITPAVELGDVLGANISVALPLEQVRVTEVSDTQDAIAEYVRKSQDVEANHINSADFSNALASANQSLIDEQAAKMYTIKNSLQKLAVPTSLVRLHKLKIVQYDAAAEVLKNFTMADSNPEYVMQNLNVFLKSQQDLEAEAQALSQKLNLHE